MIQAWKSANRKSFKIVVRISCCHVEAMSSCFPAKKGVYVQCLLDFCIGENLLELMFTLNKLFPGLSPSSLPMDLRVEILPTSMKHERTNTSTPMSNMRFVVVRPGPVVAALPGFRTAIEMIEAALNSSAFFDLFFDLCGTVAVAVALHFQRTEADARDQRTSWTMAHPVPAEWLTITIDGDVLDNNFGQYQIDTRRITLDMSILPPPADRPDYDRKAAFLLFVKGLHEAAHSLTELILRFLKYVYRDAPYRKRRRISTKNTPPKIRRLAVTKGECGYQVEQLLSNNMRFSYQRAQLSRHIDQLTLVSTTGIHGMLPGQAHQILRNGAVWRLTLVASTGGGELAFIPTVDVKA